MQHVICEVMSNWSKSNKSSVRIYLTPKCGGVEEWSKKVKILKYPKLYVSKSKDNRCYSEILFKESLMVSQYMCVFDKHQNKTS